MSAAGLEGIDIYSGVSVTAREGFCRIEATLDDGTCPTGQLSPDEVRQMALGWLQAAEAAEHDAAVLAELTETLGVTLEVAGHFPAPPRPPHPRARRAWSRHMSAARRLNADRGAVVILTILFGVTIAGASFVLSFNGLRDVATWGRVPVQLAWLVPVMIDAAVLCYTLAWLVQRARRESVWLSWCSLALFTAVSTLGNTLHGWEPSTAVQRIVGTAVVGLAPLAMLLATHTLAQLLTEHVPRTTDTATTTATTPPTTGSIPTVTAVVNLDDVRKKFTTRRHARPQTRRHRPRTPDRQALAAKIRQLRDGTGAPFTAIGAELGISKSRAHAIYQKATTS